VAVESIPLPLSASLPSVRSASFVPTRAQAEGYRAAIAIAAASVFIAGVGSVYVHVRADQALDAKAPVPVVLPLAGAAAAVTVAAPAADAGPARHFGNGSAVDIKEPSLGPITTPAYPRSASSYQQAIRATASHHAGSASTAASSNGRPGYLVRNGDDFGGIAARFGISLERVASLNPGVESTRLSIGQSLRLR
jgi:hypothetical protein